VQNKKQGIEFHTKGVLTEKDDGKDADGIWCVGIRKLKVLVKWDRNSLKWDVMVEWSDGHLSS